MNKKNIFNNSIENSLRDKTILFLNTGSSSSTGTEDFKFILKRIGEMGINVIAVSKEINIRQKCIKHWILSELFEHDKTIRVIEEFISNHPEIKIDGAVTFHEDTVLLTAKVTERLKLAGIPFKVADLARNKYRFREFCAKNNLPTPKYFKINNRADLIHVREKLEFPIVLKPIYGAASAFVIKVNNHVALQDTYDYIRKNISKKIDSSLGSISTLLAEEYIDGDEVDINILVQNGRIKFYNITDNHQTDEPFFIETGMTEPSALLDSQKKDLIDMADEILEVLNIQNGCLQFEAKSTKRGPMPLEINLRMGGDEAYYFAKEAWGVDLIEGAMKIATRVHLKKVDKNKYPRKYFAGETMHAPYSGVVSKIEIDNEIKNNKYLENLVIYKKVGDSVLAPPFGYEYMGWLSVSGPNPVDASDKLKRVLKKINYSVVKFDESSSMGKTIRQEKNKNAVFSVNKKFIGKERIEKIRSIPLAQQRKLHIGIVGNDYSLDNSSNNTNKRIKYIIKDLGSPVLIEEYVDGDEYDAFIMGNDEKNFKVLPLSRTIFSNLPENYWHIKTMKSKLGRDKIYQEKIITQIPPVKMSSKLMSLITEIAIDTYNILDCHDYGAVEIKIDKNNNPYILELNTNPRLGAQNFGPQAAKFSGMNYANLLEEIIRLAIERYKKNPPYHHLQTRAS